MEIINYVVIATRKGGCGTEEKEEKLYNFNEIIIQNCTAIRVCCGERFYYFNTYESYIKEVKWFEE